MRVKVGTYSGDGVDAREISGVGFRPDFVLVKGGTNIAALRTSTMVGDLSKPMSGATALTANLVESLTGDGFTVGSDARVNANGTTYYYLAIGDDGVDNLYLSTYTGNDVDDRDITGVPFQPDIVMIFGDLAADPSWRSSQQQAGANSTVTFTAVGNDRIQLINSDGFQVGVQPEVNDPDIIYHFICMKHVSGSFSQTWYTGDATDNRSITGAGFRPEFALVQTQSGYNQAAALRFKDEVGDLSFVVNGAEAANRIQAFEADGIQVGTTGNVNSTTASAKYVAVFLKDFAGASAVTGSARGYGMMRNSRGIAA